MQIQIKAPNLLFSACTLSFLIIKNCNMDHHGVCAKFFRTLSSKFKIFTTPLNTESGTLTEGEGLLNEWVSQGSKKETLCTLCGREVEFTEVLCPECKPKFQKFLKRAPDVDILGLSNRKPLNARADQTRAQKGDKHAK